MNIMGIQAFYYNHAAALICDGKLKFFIENEKINRIKGSREGFPVEAIKAGLNFEGLRLDDIEEIAYPSSPFRYTWSVFKQGSRSLIEALLNFKNSDNKEAKKISLIPDRILVALSGFPYFRKNLIKHNIRFSGLYGKLPKIVFVPHHLAHAASVFYSSGMDKATIVIADGLGDTYSTTIWKGEGLSLKKLQHISFPNSLGEFYAAFTEFCGFKTYEQEGKLMGLAAYGHEDEEIYEKMKKVIQIEHEKYNVSAKYTINGSHSYGVSFSDELVKLFGQPRKRDGEITQKYKNIAYAAQDHLEKATLEIIRKAVRLTGIKDVCFSGGVAMNCKLNGVIERSGLVDNLFVFPASNDAGAALGAAMIRAIKAGEDPRFKLEHTYYGPGASDKEIEEILNNIKTPYTRIDLNDLNEVVDLLINKKVVGLYTLRSEFGARALGARSIIADPRTKEMVDIVNKKVKRREPWRPFAPVIIEGFENEYFIDGKISKYMMKAYQIRPEKRHIIPAVIHVDDTCRPQSINEKTNPVYYKILKNFYERTGVPVLLNTSFNVRGEPIVSRPIDALRCYLSTGMDALLIGPYLLKKNFK
jgi:carbamoyltransferase